MQSALQGRALGSITSSITSSRTKHNEQYCPQKQRIENAISTASNHLKTRWLNTNAKRAIAFAVSKYPCRKVTHIHTLHSVSQLEYSQDFQFRRTTRGARFIGPVKSNVGTRHDDDFVFVSVTLACCFVAEDCLYAYVIVEFLSLATRMSQSPNGTHPQWLGFRRRRVFLRYAGCRYHNALLCIPNTRGTLISRLIYCASRASTCNRPYNSCVCAHLFVATQELPHRNR